MTELNLHKFLVHIKSATEKNDYQLIDKAIEILRMNRKNELIYTAVIDYLIHMIYVNYKSNFLSTTQIFMLTKKITEFLTADNFSNFYNAISQYKNAKKIILFFLSLRSDYKNFFIFINDEHITVSDCNRQVEADLLVHYVNRNRLANKKHREILKVFYNREGNDTLLIKLFSILRFDFKCIVKYKFYRYMSLATLDIMLKKIKTMKLTYTNLLVAQKIFYVKYYSFKNNKGREKFIQLIMTGKKFTFKIMQLFLHNISTHKNIKLCNIRFFLHKIIEIASNKEEMFDLNNSNITFIKAFVTVINELIYVDKNLLIKKFIFDYAYLKNIGKILKNEKLLFFSEEYGTDSRVYKKLDVEIIEDLIAIYYADQHSTLKEKYIKKRLCTHKLHNLMHKFMQNNIFSKQFLFSTNHKLYKVKNIDKAYKYIKEMEISDNLEFTFTEYFNYKKYGKYFSNSLNEICNLYEPSYYLFMLINHYISTKQYILDSIDIYLIILKFSLNPQYFEILTSSKLIYEKVEFIEIADDIFPLYNLNFYSFDLTFHDFSTDVICKILCILLNCYDVNADLIFHIKKGLKKKLISKYHMEIFNQYVSFLYIHKILTHD